MIAIVITGIEQEKDPRNLIVVFSMIQKVANPRMFTERELDPYLKNLFE